MVKNYHVDNVTIEEILGWIKQGKIGLPEMQRPFVWSTAKVRDLIDSLYNGLSYWIYRYMAKSGSRIKE